MGFRWAPSACCTAWKDSIDLCDSVCDKFETVWVTGSRAWRSGCLDGSRQASRSASPRRVGYEKCRNPLEETGMASPTRDSERPKCESRISALHLFIEWKLKMNASCCVQIADQHIHCCRWIPITAGSLVVFATTFCVDHCDRNLLKELG